MQVSGNLLLSEGKRLCQFKSFSQKTKEGVKALVTVIILWEITSLSQDKRIVFTFSRLSEPLEMGVGNLHLWVSWQEEVPPQLSQTGAGQSSLALVEAGRTPLFRWVSVCWGSCAHCIFRDFGAGRVDACKVLDVTVSIHLKGHDCLFHGLLMTAGRG